MDPITHALLGALAGSSVVPTQHRKAAGFAGAVAAVVVDVDVFFHHPNDPLFQVEIHRQFTHSLIFVPFGALLVAWLLWWLLKGRLSKRQLYLACFAGQATAGLSDACTSYGTQLLWPFSNARFAWNLISVVDPVTTLVLAILLFLWLRQGRVLFLVLGWFWVVLSLVYGLWQRERATQAALEAWSVQGREIQGYVVKPTLGNRRLWRATALGQDEVFTQGVRLGFLGGVKVLPGESAPLLVVERDFAEFEGTVLYRDLWRFLRLSDGYLVRHPVYPQVVGDARYAMLPTSMTPLWGVELGSDPEEPLQFVTFRDGTRAVREEFMRQLLGE